MSAGHVAVRPHRRVTVPTTPDDRIVHLLGQRTTANRAFFHCEATRIAHVCHRMAERFARDGRLVALAPSAQARSDARHVAVEFVHPVIVGKRALPALALCPEGGDLAVQAELVLRPDDVVIAFGLDDECTADTGDGHADRAHAALRYARNLGCLTLAFAASDAEWVFLPPSGDPFIRQELVETLYHVLWELVHVFFDHRGLLAGRRHNRTHDVGSSRFLYPFLAEEEHDLDAVLGDVKASVLMKADAVGELRAHTLQRSCAEIVSAASALRTAFEHGGKLLAFGNGGSATDAMDVVADFRDPPHGWSARPALDLTEDPGILTAVGNDVGMDEIFARQIIAYGGEDDVALGISTSGNSRNVIAALGEARRRGLTTVAIVGYDGGRILNEGLADHLVVAPSEHIPRIQEAQASAYHVLRELVECEEV